MLFTCEDCFIADSLSISPLSEQMEIESSLSIFLIFTPHQFPSCTLCLSMSLIFYHPKQSPSFPLSISPLFITKLDLHHPCRGEGGRPYFFLTLFPLLSPSTTSFPSSAVPQFPSPYIALGSAHPKLIMHLSRIINL